MLDKKGLVYADLGIVKWQNETLRKGANLLRAWECISAQDDWRTRRKKVELAWLPAASETRRFATSEDAMPRARGA